MGRMRRSGSEGMTSVQSQGVIAAALYLMVVQDRRKGVKCDQGDAESTHQSQKQRTTLIGRRLEVGIR